MVSRTPKYLGTDCTVMYVLQIKASSSEDVVGMWAKSVGKIQKYHMDGSSGHFGSLDVMSDHGWVSQALHFEETDLAKLANVNGVLLLWGLCHDIGICCSQWIHNMSGTCLLQLYGTPQVSWRLVVGILPSELVARQVVMWPAHLSWSVRKCPQDVVEVRLDFCPQRFWPVFSGFCSWILYPGAGCGGLDTCCSILPPVGLEGSGSLKSCWLWFLSCCWTSFDWFSRNQ